MDFSVNVGLNNLHCITPTDPSGEDEPYLWVIQIKLDGSTLRQRLDNQARFTATVSARSGSGRPGNLGEATAASGGNIHIPPSIGTFDDSLRPITLNLTQGPASFRIHMPGTVAVFCLAIDEEAVPRDAMEAAFNDVKTFIVNRLNDFFNAFDIGPLAPQVIASTDPINTAVTLFFAPIGQFLTTLSGEATAVGIQSAQISVMAAGDWWNPIDIGKSIAAGLDPDEPIGSNRFMIRETDMIGASMHRILHADLRQSPTGLGGAWYFVDGFANSGLKFFPGDHSNGLSAAPNRQILTASSEYVVKSERRCLPRGQVVRMTTVGFTEQHEVFVKYPFLTYRYLVDGKELVGNGGKVQIQKSVFFPQFDENEFYFLGAREESRLVTVAYAKNRPSNEPQIEKLVLSNDPADGNYELSIKIEAVLPNGSVIPVTTTGIDIRGQSIEFADNFFENYVECIARFLKEKHIRVKPTIPASWRTPEVRWREYEEMSRGLDTLVKLGLADAAAAKIAKQQIATRLRLAGSD